MHLTEKEKELLHGWGSLILALVMIAVLLKVPLKEPTKEVVFALVVVFGLHSLDHIVFWTATKGMIKEVVRNAAATEFDSFAEKISAIAARSISEAKHTATEMVGDLTRSINTLVRAANDCGIKRIYINRLEAFADVTEAIRTAKKTVRLMGIAFSGAIPFEVLVDRLKKNEEVDKLDLRILLLDPLRSPGVFRTFLETTPEEVRFIVRGRGPKKGKPDLETLFRQTRFEDCRHAQDVTRRELDNGAQFLEKAAKFYGHSPMCWLVIADDTAFFEPYTLGKSPNQQNSLLLGQRMPVFAFKSTSDTFKILEDHFDKTWRTTDMTLDSVFARRKDRFRVAADLFKHRASWFEKVCGALSWDGSEKRAWPQQACEDDWSVSVNWYENEEGSPRLVGVLDATVRDYSRDGMSLLLKGFSGDVRPKKGDLLKLNGAPPPEPHLVNSLTQGFWNEFLEIKWPEILVDTFDPWPVGVRKKKLSTVSQ